jgi:hypothetical protein
VTAILTYALFFGLSLPSLRRGQPHTRWWAKLAQVFPLFFVFVVVWPHVTVPCSVELGRDMPEVPPSTLRDMASAIESTVRTGVVSNSATDTPRSLRPVHPKAHGCVKATLFTPYRLPAKFRFGIFSEDAWSGITMEEVHERHPGIQLGGSKAWTAFVRFSNGAMPKTSEDGVRVMFPDSTPDVRGMAVKVLLHSNHSEHMSLTEEEIASHATDRNTQDFVSITSDYFALQSVVDYADFIRAVGSGHASEMLKWILPRGFSWADMKASYSRVRTLWLANRMNRDGAAAFNPLAFNYFSAVPCTLHTIHRLKSWSSVSSFFLLACLDADRLGPEAQAASSLHRSPVAVKMRWQPCQTQRRPGQRPEQAVPRLLVLLFEPVKTGLNTIARWLYSFCCFLTSRSEDADWHLFSRPPLTSQDREAEVAAGNPENFLRINMQNTLHPRHKTGHTSPTFLLSDLSATDPEHGACFDLLLQDQSDACVNPIEDSTVPWTGAWIRAARLLIPHQTFLAQTQVEACENMSFNPWHSLAQHRPLGAINKLRRNAYLTAAKARRALNQVGPNFNGTVYTGNELDPSNAIANGELFGNAASYSYSISPPPFQALPKHIAHLPAHEEMDQSISLNMRRLIIATQMASTYPQRKLSAEFHTPQDYANLLLGGADEPAYPNTNQLRSGRMRPHYHVNESIWTQDIWWAQQFIQGVNPMVIQKLQSLSQLQSVQGLRNLSADIIRSDIAEVLSGRSSLHSLDQLVHAGRLFLVDYESMRDLITYEQRVLYAPMVLFFLSDISDRTLLPLLIQLERGAESVLYFPPKQFRNNDPIDWSDQTSMTWLFARMHVSSADAVMHQLIYHLLETHLVMEPVIIATHRAFAADHVIRRLLRQHFNGTLGTSKACAARHGSRVC